MSPSPLDFSASGSVINVLEAQEFSRKVPACFLYLGGDQYRPYWTPAMFTDAPPEPLLLLGVLRRKKRRLAASLAASKINRLMIPVIHL